MYWLVIPVGIIHIERAPVFTLVIGYAGYLIIYIGRIALSPANRALYP